MDQQEAEAEGPSSDAEKMAVISDYVRGFVEIASGHRRVCLEAGFSETAAEHMAVELHDGLLHNMFCQNFS